MWRPPKEIAALLDKIDGVELEQRKRHMLLRIRGEAVAVLSLSSKAPTPRHMRNTMAAIKRAADNHNAWKE